MHLINVEVIQWKAGTRSGNISQVMDGGLLSLEDGTIYKTPVVPLCTSANVPQTDGLNGD